MTHSSVIYRETEQGGWKGLNDSKLLALDYKTDILCEEKGKMDWNKGAGEGNCVQQTPKHKYYWKHVQPNFYN